MNTSVHSQKGFAKVAIAAVIGIVIIFSALSITSITNKSEIQVVDNGAAQNNNDQTPESPAPMNLNETRLSPGVTSDVSGLLITLNEVVQDNRCATDVQCIEAGAITVNVTLEADGIKMTRNIASDEVPTEFEGRKISIIKIMPEAVSTVTIAPKDYKVTFKID